MRSAKGKRLKVRLTREDFLLVCRGTVMFISTVGQSRPDEDGVNHLKNRLERSRRFEGVTKSMQPNEDRHNYKILTIQLPLDMSADTAYSIMNRIIEAGCVHMRCPEARNTKVIPAQDRGVTLRYANQQRHHPVWVAS